MKLFEEKISGENIYEGKILSLHRDKVRLEDGKESYREVIEHHGGACIVALTDDDEVLLVQQFRYPFSRVVTEIPAGKLEKGEDPDICARRELLEETGYEAGRLIKIDEFLPTPAYCKEVSHIYFADNLKKKEAKLDDGEFLEVLKMPFSEAIDMILDGKIRDGKTEIGILKVKALKDAGKL